MKIVEQKENEKYLSEERLKSLQESIAFLDNYIITKGEFDFITVGNSKTELHLGKTQALSMLGSINSQRKELIDILLKINDSE